MRFEKHIQCVLDEQTALDCLSENIQLSRQQLKRAMQNGSVWLETTRRIDRVRRAKKIIQKNDVLHIYYDALIQQEPPPVAQLIADEGDYSIWNKPCGMYSQGSKWGDHCTIYRWAEQHLLPERPAFIVHRLDRAANGLIILAHKKTVAAQFSKMFETRKIYKKYRAKVEGLLTRLELPFEITTEIDNKPAISSIVSLQVDEENKTTVVEIEIKTGRKHQIRKHLSGLGFPILGDRLYEAKNIEEDLQLSSMEIAFDCPVSGEYKKFCLSV